MYIASVVLLLLVLPVVSILLQHVFSASPASLLSLVGRWFCFWAVGVRLFLAGVRQVLQPGFTAAEIFKLEEPRVWPIVRELGFANLAMGLLGILSVLHPGWVVPAAIVGGLYYGLAGAGHVHVKGKNAKEMVAMVSDWFVFVVLVVFVAKSVR